MDLSVQAACFNFPGCTQRLISGLISHSNFSHSLQSSGLYGAATLRISCPSTCHFLHEVVASSTSLLVVEHCSRHRASSIVSLSGHSQGPACTTFRFLLQRVWIRQESPFLTPYVTQTPLESSPLALLHSFLCGFSVSLSTKT